MSHTPPSSSQHSPTDPTIKANETAKMGDTIAWDTLIGRLKYNEQGLIAAIAQQFDSKQVLMMAWMNQTALEETLASGYTCFWSRSRASLWRKGETSGQKQKLLSLEIDCDGDTLLLTVDQTGPACHTGRKSCFYNRVDAEKNQVIVTSEPLIDPNTLYKT